MKKRINNAVIGLALGLVVGVPAMLIVDDLAYGDGTANAIALVLCAVIGVSLGALYTPRPTCPHCRSKVNRGATVCHHCGRELTEI